MLLLKHSISDAITGWVRTDANRSTCYVASPNLLGLSGWTPSLEFAVPALVLFVVLLYSAYCYITQFYSCHSCAIKFISLSRYLALFVQAYRDGLGNGLEQRPPSMSSISRILFPVKQSRRGPRRPLQPTVSRHSTTCPHSIHSLDWRWNFA